MKRYKIKAMGKGFDGLIVDVDEERSESFEDEILLFPVNKITNDNVIFGDRNLGFPVVKNALWISEEFLERVSDDIREYSHKNPFGSFIKTFSIERDSFKLVVTEYDRGVSVTVMDLHGHGKTLYSQNYFNNISLTSEAICARFIEQDIEDLIFELKQMKIKELEIEVG